MTKPAASHPLTKLELRTVWALLIVLALLAGVLCGTLYAAELERLIDVVRAYAATVAIP